MTYGAEDAKNGQALIVKRSESPVFRITTAQLARAQGALLSTPRELAGWAVRGIERTLNMYEGDNPASIVAEWYRTAEIAAYDTLEAAAAYLAAYGPRSYLKYQEGALGLLAIGRTLAPSTTVVDYGCGPAIGYPALLELWGCLAAALNETLTLNYIGVEPSGAMRTVGDQLCRETEVALSGVAALPVTRSCSLLGVGDELDAVADLLFVSNVMNEGEGIVSVRDFLQPVIEAIPAVNVIVIEPATEQPARQLCNLRVGALNHIGPCPNPGEDCQQWTFRAFRKHLYGFERRALGDLAPGAQEAKYSLALLSSTAPLRQLPNDGHVVISKRFASGNASICRFGMTRDVRVPATCSTWDVADRSGHVLGRWPS